MYVVTYELLRVLLKNCVNLIEKIVEFPLELFAFFGDNRHAIALLAGALATLLLDSFLFSHVSVLPVESRNQGDRCQILLKESTGEITGASRRVHHRNALQRALAYVKDNGIPVS